MPTLMDQVYAGSSTLQTINQIRNNATTVRNFLTPRGQNYASVAKITNPDMKRVFDWFRHKETGIDSSEESESDQQSELTQVQIQEKSSHGFMQSALQIAERMINLSIHLTSNTISAVDNRSSDIVSATMQTGNIVDTISKKLDRMIASKGAMIERQRRNDDPSFFDDSGKMSLRTFWNAFQVVGVKRIMDETGLSTLDQRINETILDTTSLFFESLAKSDVFVHLFGNQLLNKARDYSSFVSNKNEYTFDTVAFDGATRKSIITVIPEYLKKISEQITGITYHVSEHGELTTEKNRGLSTVLDTTLTVSSLVTDRLKSKSDVENTDNSDTDDMLYVLISNYVFYVYQHHLTRIPSDFFYEGGIRSINMDAVDVCVRASGINATYWNYKLTRLTALMMSDHAFARRVAEQVNLGFKAIHQAAIKYAEEYGGTKLVFTKEMFDRRTIQMVSERHGIFRQNHDDHNQDSSIPMTPEVVKLKYVAKIFQRLTDGILIHVMDQPFNHTPMEPTKVSSDDIQPDQTNRSDQKQNTQQTKPVENPLRFGLQTTKRVVSKVVNSILQKGIFASLKASSKDGDVSEQDAASMRNIANQIDDPEQKSQVSKTIDTANQVTKAKTSQSILGRGLLFIFGIAKTAITKFVSTSASFLASIIRKLKDTMTKGIDNIISGGKAIKESLFGSDESQGIFKDIFKRKNKDDEEKKPKTQSTASIQPVDNQKQQTNESTEETTASVTGTQSKQSKPITAKTSFGQGFQSVFRKQTETEIKPTTVFDDTSQSIDRLVQQKTASKRTLFGALFGILDSIRDGFRRFFSKDEIKDETDDTGEEGSTAKKTDKGIGFDLGKFTGGLLDVLKGILKSMTAVVATLSSIQAIIDLAQSILENSLKPLNKVFFAIRDMIKPIIDMVTKTLKTIIDTVSTIASALIKTIAPIFNILSPIVDGILKAIQPLFELVNGLVNVLMVPMTAIMKAYVVPYIQIMSNEFMMHLGVIEAGFGAVITALGGVLWGVGLIGKLFGASGLSNAGKNAINMGISLVKTGTETVINSVKGTVSTVVNTAKSIVTGDVFKLDTNTSSQKTTSSNQKITTPSIPTGSPMEGVFGSGEGDGYQFSDDIKDALKNLKSITSRIVSVFIGEDDSVEQNLQNEEEKQTAARMQIETADLSDEDRENIDKNAFELFKAEHPQYEGESEQEYRKRYEDNKTRYWTIAATKAVQESVENSPGNTSQSVISVLKDALGDDGAMSGFTDAMLQAEESTQAGGALQSISDAMGLRNRSNGLGKEDLIMSAAKVFKAYGDKNPKFTYQNSIWGKILVDDVDRNIRPDCSGMLSAAIQTLGYKLKGAEGSNGEAGVRSGVFASNTNFILDSNGEISKDWIKIPFSKDKLQRGDITAAWFGSHGHVSMPITDLENDTPRGFDAGTGETGSSVSKIPHGSGLYKSWEAASRLISGDSKWEDSLKSAMGKTWSSSGGAQMILRFLGKPASYYRGSSVVGENMTDRDIFAYLTNNLGMTPQGAAGLMGVFWYESRMKSNNLEDAYQGKKFFGMSDEEYTAAVNSGHESEKDFVKGRNYTYISGQVPGEAVGYGISQFTSSSLKQDLYNRTVKQNKSIADTPSQLDMIIAQLKQRGLYQSINQSKTATDANKLFLWKYAAGYSYKSDAQVLNAYPWLRSKTDGYANGVLARHGKAEEYYRKFYGSGDMDDEDDTQPMVVNSYEVSTFNMDSRLDEITSYQFDIDSSHIYDIMNEIMNELPEYLDGEDELDDMDDEQLMSMFVSMMT